MRSITRGIAALGLLALAVASRPIAAADKTGGVTIQAGKDHIDFKIGSQLVGRYRFGPDVAKPYLWPLNAPGGVPVTRAWPMEPVKPGGSADHPHQKSAWFCHGDVLPEGIPLKDKIKGVKGVDFWSEAKGHGRIVCTEVSSLGQRDRAAAVVTKNEWQMADGTKIMDETRTIQLHDLGKAWLFVFNIDLHATVAPITFGDTKEGFFGVRVNDAITTDKPGKGGRGKGQGKLENAGGKVGESGCWGQLSPWCDYSGPIDGKIVGITIFDDPKNSSPACWHARGYGLMAANPFGRTRSFPAMKDRTDLVHLNKGDHLRLRYGLLLHAGDAQAGQVAELYQRFLKLREGGLPMKFAAIIEYLQDKAKIAEVRPIHRQYLASLKERGQLAASGPFTDDSGALIIYEAASRDEAEAILQGDPFHQSGIFLKWQLRPWNPVIANRELFPQ